MSVAEDNTKPAAKHEESSKNTSDDMPVVTGFNRRVLFILVLLGFGSASMGYAASIIATTLTQPSFYVKLNLTNATNLTALIGATNGLFYTGGAFGSIFSGYVAHKYGRKISAGAAALTILISSAIICGSTHIAMFITFRFFQGYGCFNMMSTIPMWMAELVPPKKRGMLVQIHPAMINFGYVVASYTGVGFYYFHDPSNNQWRGPMGLAGFFPLLFLLGIYWIPESPRYLLANDKTDAAWEILRQLHSHPRDPEHLYAKKELYQIQQQMQLDKEFSAPTVFGNYGMIAMKKSLRNRALLTMFVTFAQMGSGALVINNYGGLIYKSLGFGEEDILQFQGGYQLCAWVMNTAGMLTIDFFPRNKLMSFGFATMVVTVIIETALQKNFLGTTNQAGLSACVALLFLNVTLYGLSVEGVGFLYIAEIWPSYARTEGYALGIFSLCVSSIIWTQAAPTAFANIGWKYYIIFIVVNAVASAVLYFVPDTRGKPLEEIAALFGDGDQVAVYQDGIQSEKLREPHRGEDEIYP